MSRPKKTGRPCKLTPEVILTVCEAIRLCLPLVDCAEAGGIHYDTYRQWMRRGLDEYQRREKNARRDLDAPRLTEENLTDLARLPAAALPDDINRSDRLFLAFFEEVTRAQAQAKRAILQRIREAAEPRRVTKTIKSTRHVVLGTGEDKRVVPVTDVTIEEVEEQDWRPAAWIAERRWPQDFAKRLEVAEVDYSVFTEEELEEISKGGDPAKVLARRPATARADEEPVSGT